MTHYTYSLSLWIEHPDADLSEVPDKLGLIPARLWKKGDRVTTPTGRVMEGTYHKSYCSIKITDHADGDLAVGLKAALDFLLPHKDYLAKLAAKGAALKFFVGLFSKSGNPREELDWRLLSQLADLKISLDLDFYESDPESEATAGP